MRKLKDGREPVRLELDDATGVFSFARGCIFARGTKELDEPIHSEVSFASLLHTLSTYDTTRAAQVDDFESLNLHASHSQVTPLRSPQRGTEAFNTTYPAS